ncbi:NAD(P)-dependent alcohol dehydrogenase [Chryseobacterium hispalense]|uniref:NAD(P)-dependent alcohol dehydrogenase n=1 Tax=Chryseobacterium hispalense TaxID=1453492 RepID=UPI0004932B69|nr:NAD(P)-dependent alcohol dehydrogenase [Chryseobacterium hispalense]
MDTKKIKALGAKTADSPLDTLVIERRVLGVNDVEIDILYCGICHSDLHAVKNDWGNTNYPVVPGHEIVGRIKDVGKNVTKFKVGDLTGVGCIVDSCRNCDSCSHGFEQFCENGFTLVFDGPDKHLAGRTYGGFSESIVMDSNYVLKIPESLDLASAAPLLCGGITVYSPLKHWKAGPGKKVGIIGIGGLGHLAIKIARAMGAHVTVFTRSEDKLQDAKRLGAHDAVLSNDPEQMRKQSKYDLLIDTVSAKHEVNMFLDILNIDGSLVLVGLPNEPLEIGAFNVVNGRKSFSGSNIGGIAETQEMLDFFAEHKLAADVEVIKVDQVNEALDRLERGDVKYRFVIDMASLKN